MKPSSMLPILLIAGGIVAVVYQGFTYTTREKVIDVGDIHVMADKTKSIALSPVIGVLAIVGGVVLLVAGKRTA